MAFSAATRVAHHHLHLQHGAMSLPGLGLAEPEEVSKVETAQHDLVKESEWRFEVAAGRYTNVKILSGSAELFGTELVVGNTYIFTNTKAAIYTWQGCSIEVGGDALASEYTAEETPMNEYINTHFALESIREQAKAAGKEGPRLLILGPEDAGKSTLAKIITSYSIRVQRSPVVVNLDVNEGIMALPGTLSATVFKSLIDVEEGWASAPSSGPTGSIPAKLPLVYYYGQPDPTHKDGKIYKAQISRLALAVTGRISQDPDARAAGLIIDTPGILSTTNKTTTDILSHIVSEFSINCIACLGSERLYSDIAKRFDNTPVSTASTSASASATPTVSVIKLSKSGGCVDRDDSFMSGLRAAQIRTYFYGNPRLSTGVALQPRQQTIDFSTLTLYRRIGSFPISSYNNSNSNPAHIPDDEADEFLPGDFGTNTEAPSINNPATSSSVPLPASQIFERVLAPEPAMRSSVFAVLNCPAESEQDVIRDATVMGFLYVTDVDDVRGKISLLSPVAGRVPEKAVVWAGWPESVLGLKD